RRRIHVCRRGNRARTAIPHICEKERFAAHKHVKPRRSSPRRVSDRTGGFCKRVKKSFGVIPIARAVFHPRDRAWISVQKALDQFWSDPDDRHRRNMVEINSQTRIPNALHYFAEVTVKAFFADVLVIKRR